MVVILAPHTLYLRNIQENNTIVALCEAKWVHVAPHGAISIAKSDTHEVLAITAALGK